MICELNSPERALLAELRAVGLNVAAEGGRLRIEGRREQLVALPPELLARAKKLKLALLALLNRPQHHPTSPPPGPPMGSLLQGPWGPPEVLSLGCSPGAAAFALSAIAAHVPTLDAAARHAHQRDGLSPDDTVIVLGVGAGGPLPDGTTIVMPRRWYEAHWTRQKTPLRPCPRGRVVVVVVDGRGGRGVVCSYAPPRLPRRPQRRP